MDNRPSSIAKILSRNDLGLTGSHQAGMVVPKDINILRFFPELDGSVKNPRVILKCLDVQKKDWNFNFIYYNGKFFGGTRNEYRLTGMTAFLRENDAQVGDTVVLRRAVDGTLHIECNPACSMPQKEAKDEDSSDGNPVKHRLVIRSGWKIINY